MTKEDIETRKKELSDLLDQALANANALRGAIQDCEFWLNRLAQEETEKPPMPRIVEDERAAV